MINDHQVLTRSWWKDEGDVRELSLSCLTHDAVFALGVHIMSRVADFHKQLDGTVGAFSPEL